MTKKQKIEMHIWLSIVYVITVLILIGFAVGPLFGSFALNIYITKTIYWLLFFTAGYLLLLALKIGSLIHKNQTFTKFIKQWLKVTIVAVVAVGFFYSAVTVDSYYEYIDATTNVLGMEINVQDISNLSTSGDTVNPLDIIFDETSLAMYIKALVAGEEVYFETPEYALKQDLTELQALNAMTFTIMQNKINDNVVSITELEVENATLQTQLVTALAERNAILAIISTIQEEANTKALELANNGVAIANLNTELANAQATLTAHTLQITAIENSIETMQAEINAHTLELASLNTELAEAVAISTAQTLQIIALENNVITMQAELDAQNLQLTNLNTELANAVDPEEIAILENTIALLQAEINLHTLELTNLNTELTSVVTTATAQTLQITTLENTIAPMQTELDAQALELTALTTELITVQASVIDPAEITALENAIASLTAIKDAQTLELADLTTQLGVLNTSLIEKQTALDTVNAQITVLQGQVSVLEIEVLAIRAEFETADALINERIDSVESNIVALQSAGGLDLTDLSWVIYVISGGSTSMINGIDSQKQTYVIDNEADFLVDLDRTLTELGQSNQFLILFLNDLVNRTIALEEEVAILQGGA